MVKKALFSCKKLFALLRGITSKNNGDYDCINCLVIMIVLIVTLYENVCENHNYCFIEMPEKVTNIINRM